MEIADIEAKIRSYKAAGHTSRVDLPFNVVEKLIADAKAWQSAPEMMRQAVKEMGEPK